MLIWCSKTFLIVINVENSWLNSLYHYIFLQIAWALNKGIKAEFKQYWDVELGVTYVPWSKAKMEDLDVFREGGMLDPDTLAPGKYWNFLVM